MTNVFTGILDTLNAILGGIGSLFLSLFGGLAKFFTDVPEWLASHFESLIQHLPTPIVHSYDVLLPYLALANAWIPIDYAVTLLFLGLQWLIFINFVRLVARILGR